MMQVHCCSQVSGQSGLLSIVPAVHPLLILSLYMLVDLTSVDQSRIYKPSAVEYEGSCRLVSDQFRCII